MMINTKSVIIIGAGGQAAETESYVKRSGGKVLFFAVDKEFINDKQNLINVSKPPENLAGMDTISAVGAPLMRKKLVNSWPGVCFITVISSDASIDDDAIVLEGTTVGSYVFIAPGVKIGKHCLVNTNASIGHNSTLGDYVTISPGTNIGGNVTIEDGVFIGMGAVIKNNVYIAEGVVVGAGSLVLNDITVPNSVYVGSPAKKLRVNTGWLDEIK